MEKLIILDTETTGLEVSEEHRIIEIGAVEVINREITNNEYHRYIQPDRLVGKSFDVHEISDEFLKDKPRFSEIADEFIEFIKGQILVIHNAPFDIGFLNHEFKLIGKKVKINDICQVIDSQEISKKIHAGGRHNLDSICRRYNIDISSRVKHGALLDAQILAKAYLALTSGQFNLFGDSIGISHINEKITKISKNRAPINIIYASEDEIKKHNEYFN